MASITLVVHIVAGTIGILAGYAALFLPKGTWLHRRIGSAFVAAMGFNGASAAVLGLLQGTPEDVVGGFMTVYFVSTAWMAARRRDHAAGTFESCAFLVALAFVAITAHDVYVDLTGRSGSWLGQPVVANAIVICIMGSAAALDLNLVLRGGLSHTHRLARHVWRICAGLFIAAGSFFLGQMQVFPEPLRRIELMALPVVLLVVVAVFWLARVLLTKHWRRPAVRLGSVPQ